MKPITITYDTVVKHGEKYAMLFSVDLGDVNGSPAKEAVVMGAILDLIEKRMSPGGPVHVPASVSTGNTQEAEA